MKELTVREARRRRQLTQQALAELSGVNQTTISDMETGRHVNPRLTTVHQLAAALRIPPSKLRFNSSAPSQSVADSGDRSGHSRARRRVESEVA